MTTLELPAALDQIHEFIRRDIAAGFDPPALIVYTTVEAYAEEFEPALLRPHAERITRTALDEHLREQADWPAITDCDRLDAAFAALEEHGIVCRHHFSCCGTCGAAEIWQELDDLREDGRLIRGYAFYHMQDTEAAIAGNGLYLSYGAVEDSTPAALQIGYEIVSALHAQGLPVEWNGRLERRILVALDWKRRRGVQYARAA